MTSPNPIPLFLFYLVNAEGDSWYKDSTGLITRRGMPTPIEYSPDGWEDNGAGWERNLDKMGLVRSYTPTYGFVGDGGEILEHIYNRENVDFRTWLLVQKLDLEVTDIDFALVHKFFYKIELDFSSYRKTRRKVLCNGMDGGRSKDLKANEATPYAIPIQEDPDKIRVRFDGMTLENKGVFAVSNGSPDLGDPFWNFKNHIMNLDVIRKEVEDIGTAQATVREQVANNNTNIQATKNWFFKASVAGTVKVDFDFTLQIEYTPGAPAANPGASVRSVVRRIDITGFGTSFDLLATGTGALMAGVYHVVGSVDVPVVVGDELYPFTFCNVQGATGDAQLRFTYAGDAPLFNVTYLYKVPESFVWMHRAKTVNKRLTQKISGSEDFCLSGLLEVSKICFTSGNALRGLDKSKLMITAANFFQCFRGLKRASLGVEKDIIVMEKMDNFLADDVIIDLGEVKTTPEVAPAIDILANTIKGGYPDPKIEGLNGKYETNAAVLWTLPLKRVTRELNIVVPFRADAIGMEALRFKYFGEITTDTENDNEVFIAAVDLDNPQADVNGTYYNLLRRPYTSVTGIPHPADAYNIEELTPRRAFNEWKPWIRSILRRFDNEYVIHDNSTKNEDLVTIGGPGGDVTESEDTLIAQLGAPLFSPDKITITAVPTANMYYVLNYIPRACFRFTYKGNSFKGFLLKASLKAKANPEQQFILLSHKDNDLTLLENE